MSRVSDKPYFLYVLWSPSAQRFYIGVNESLTARLEQHNSGTFAGWTKRHRPWRLVFSETHSNYAEARHRELDLKAQKGGTGFFARQVSTLLDLAAAHNPAKRDRWFKSTLKSTPRNQLSSKNSR